MTIGANPARSSSASGALDFWFDLASTYSYLSASRITRLAEEAMVAVRWRPMLLGAIFKRQGWDTSPFNLQPAKGEYMWRDFARRAAHQGLSPTRPDGFPQNSLAAARATLVGLAEGWGQRFVAAIYDAEFNRGADIAERGVLSECVETSGGSATAALAAADSAEIKALLRGETQSAIEAGVFGAPAFTVGDELFWGDDRLEDALLWAAGRHPCPRSR